MYRIEFVQTLFWNICWRQHIFATDYIFRWFTCSLEMVLMCRHLKSLLTYERFGKIGNNFFSAFTHRQHWYDVLFSSLNWCPRNYNSLGLIKNITLADIIHFVVRAFPDNNLKNYKIKQIPNRWILKIQDMDQNRNKNVEVTEINTWDRPV